MIISSVLSGASLYLYVHIKHTVFRSFWNKKTLNIKSVVTLYLLMFVYMNLLFVGFTFMNVISLVWLITSLINFLCFRAVMILYKNEDTNEETKIYVMHVRPQCRIFILVSSVSTLWFIHGCICEPILTIYKIFGNWSVWWHDWFLPFFFKVALG